MFDSPTVRRGCQDVLEALGAARAEIDALNVYPVPDGDTGTNLFLTVESAVEELLARPDDADVGADLRALAHGALLGARGNSGVILSQLLRGALPALDPSRVDAAAVAAALEGAALAGYRAVAAPVEGTVLTVAKAAASAATTASVTAQASAAHVLVAAAGAAQEALARTPDLLPALREAGVVDAGGRGLTVVLDALVATATGRRPTSPPAAGAGTRSAGEPAPGEARHGAPGGPEFEVMYLLEAGDDATETLRGDLAALGDSLLVVGGDGLWNVHVHVDDVGAAIEAGIRAGRPYRIAVAHFAEQVARQQAARVQGTRAVVALVPGAGLADLAARCGARVVESSDGRRPATRDVLLAVQQAHADEVVVLPDDRDTVAVAEAAAEYARTAGLRVAVIPTRAPVQVLAALAVHDPARRFDDDVVAMTAAARATRRGAVTHAVREALTSAGVCHPGDVLGMVEDDVAVIGSDVAQVAMQVLDRMLSAGGELVTVVIGADATLDLGDQLAGHLRRAHVEVDVQVHDGGQQLYPVLLGVE